MSQYELLIGNKELYEMIAGIYYECGDIDMCIFYKNVSLGFQIRANNLSLAEADSA